MSNYPPGAAEDPSAPWKEPEPVECPRCGGNGVEAYADPPEACTECDGRGTIDPRELPEEEYDAEADL
jgi:DnaJ-class molecular chaperone